MCPAQHSLKQTQAWRQWLQGHPVGTISCTGRAALEEGPTGAASSESLGSLSPAPAARVGMRVTLERPGSWVWLEVLGTAFCHGRLPVSPAFSSEGFSPEATGLRLLLEFSTETGDILTQLF